MRSAPEASKKQKKKTFEPDLSLDRLEGVEGVEGFVGSEVVTVKFGEHFTKQFAGSIDGP